MLSMLDLMKLLRAWILRRKHGHPYESRPHCQPSKGASEPGALPGRSVGDTPPISVYQTRAAANHVGGLLQRRMHGVRACYLRILKSVRCRRTAAAALAVHMILEDTIWCSS